MAKQSKAWKSWELEGAHDLGGKRTGPMGFGLPDVSGLPDLAPEFKYQKRLALRTADLEQAKLNARGKPWGLFLREAHTGRRVVVLDYKHFIKLWKELHEDDFVKLMEGLE